MKKLFKVKKEDGADIVGSGSLPVLSTPMLIAYMENVAQLEATSRCQEHQSSVGIEINMRHLKASAIGSDIQVEVTMIEQNKSILNYHIKAFDQGQLVAEASHKRAIIDVESFMSKVN